MTSALVTGGSGYLGTRLISDLLQTGIGVRTTVRSLDSEAGLRRAVRRGGSDDGGLEVVVASLTDDDGWADAVAGVDGIHHVASPMSRRAIRTTWSYRRVTARSASCAPPATRTSGGWS